MKVKIPEIRLNEMPKGFVEQFCQELGPDARFIITPVVQRNLAIELGATPTQAAQAWRQPYDLLLTLRDREDPGAERVSQVLNDLKREPHGDLAHALSEAPVVDLD